ncbi:MAG: TIGR03564 family F420-dependent LLM class oxidoreductase [Microthrixaceae bacterium]|nr:TIGR03564 family F420-dependent LLM class oxidoreductase [Microthrixaceae bacterium]
MRITINASGQILFGTPIAGLIEHARQAEADGFAGYWINQLSGTDALTVLALLGRATERIELGTAVIPTWGHSPDVLAGQALTAQAASGDRIALGIGLSHEPSVEARYHVPFARPLRHMREYLDVLLPLLHERQVDVVGEIWSCTTEFVVPPSAAPPVIVAALGPKMLKLAGARAEGTILWLVGPRTVAEHIAPSINAAAEAAGRPAPRVVASLPVCVTDDPKGVRETVAMLLAGYNDLPSYRAMLDREGAAGPADVAIIGDEDEVAAGLAAFADAGATEFAAVEFTVNDADAARTRALLKSLAARG